MTFLTTGQIQSQANKSKHKATELVIWMTNRLKQQGDICMMREKEMDGWREGEGKGGRGGMRGREGGRQREGF